MRSDRARRFPEGIREPCLLTGLMGLTGCLALHVGMWRDSFFAVLLRACCRTGSDETARQPRIQESNPAVLILHVGLALQKHPPTPHSGVQARRQGANPAVLILHVGLALQMHPPTPQSRSCMWA